MRNNYRVRYTDEDSKLRYVLVCKVTLRELVEFLDREYPNVNVELISVEEAEIICN